MGLTSLKPAEKNASSLTAAGLEELCVFDVEKNMNDNISPVQSGVIKD